MSGRRYWLLSAAALVWPVVVQAQVFDITRELGAPQHNYLNSPPFSTSSTDALPVPAAPNVTFAISGNSTIRLRLIAPAGKKFVASRPVRFSWPGDLKLAGSAPVSTVEG